VKPKKAVRSRSSGNISKMLEELKWQVEQGNRCLQQAFLTRLDEIGKLIGRTAGGSLDLQVANLTRICEQILKPTMETLTGELRALRWMVDRGMMFRPLDAQETHIPLAPKPSQPVALPTPGSAGVIPGASVDGGCDSPAGKPVAPALPPEGGKA